MLALLIYCAAVLVIVAGVRLGFFKKIMGGFKLPSPPPPPPPPNHLGYE